MVTQKVPKKVWHFRIVWKYFRVFWKNISKMFQNKSQCSERMPKMFWIKICYLVQRLSKLFEHSRIVLGTFQSVLVENVSKNVCISECFCWKCSKKNVCQNISECSVGKKYLPKMLIKNWHFRIVWKHFRVFGNTLKWIDRQHGPDKYDHELNCFIKLMRQAEDNDGTYSHLFQKMKQQARWHSSDM